jgi:hypothetical protein
MGGNPLTPNMVTADFLIKEGVIVKNPGERKMP